jgi:DNA replication licensing factor MCM6
MVAHIAASYNVRFEPYLRNACKRFVLENRAGENRAPIISDDSPNKDINIAFYNIPMLKRYAHATPAYG